MLMIFYNYFSSLNIDIIIIIIEPEGWHNLINFKRHYVNRLRNSTHFQKSEIAGLFKEAVAAVCIRIAVHAGALI